MLRLHLVDEDYLNSRRTSRDDVYENSRDDGCEDSQLMPVLNEMFDPNEPVPLYELSQEQQRRLSRQRVPRRNERRGERRNERRVDRRSLSVESGADIRSESNDRQRASGSSSAPKRLKTLGLKFLNARQHFLLAACRDVSLVPSLIGLCQSWWVVFANQSFASSRLTTARVSERFLEGVWCIVAGYLLYSVLDGLMVRWIVSYSTSAAIVRMLSMSTILVAIERYLLAAFSAEGYNYGLHTWILISCALTLLYIVQNFITSNIDLKGNRRARFFDFYNIVVFAVVPVGLASFITMIGLLRSLLILRLDLENQAN